jgi:glycosyltransferase involved in cell wall biosynthesis
MSSSSMKILVLAPQPFFIQRGTPIAVRALVEGLAAEGHAVDLLVYPEGEDIEIPGVTLHRIPGLPGTRRMPPGFSLRKVIADAVMFPQAAWLLGRGRHDLMIAVEESAYMAMLLKPVFRVPYIFDVDSSIPEQIGDKYDLPGWVQNTLEAVERRASRSALAAITCCKALEDLVKGHAPDLPVQTLEDVTLVEENLPEEPPEDCRFDEPVVMYIGNLESYQGVELLMDGFAEAVSDGRPGRLVIIGGVPEHVAVLKVRAERLGIADQVSLMGPRPVEKIGQYLAQATVVCSPRTQGRNTPMKVYSYLDSGRPLLATRLSTHTQVLDDQIAMLVEPDPADMARGIRTLLEDPALRDRLAAAARARVQAEFSPAAYRRKLAAFLKAEIEPRVASS